ncbi:retrotransposon protein, putative, ty1-copia subclass [Tanacetum coccineum]|uniref:Retrotransposon protein, putative, ty1-copia subclass n=1 Tax=Tanacetum coccineum TaxID=301880 RepID=A0ABQ4ZBF9_9ASTR
MALPAQNLNNSAFRLMHEREKNFLIKFEKKLIVLEQPMTHAPTSAPNPPNGDLEEWNAQYDRHDEVACLMLAGVERFDFIQTFHACKEEEGKSVSSYVLKMKSYLKQLERLGYVLPQDINTIDELHALLIEYEKGLPKKAATPQVLAIQGVSKNNVFYFNAIPRDGIYEIDMLNLVPNVNSIYNVSNKRAKHNLDFTFMRHCRRAHISKKRIEKLQHDGFLKSTNDESFDQCISCLSSKMPRKPFPHQTDKATDLLRLLHTDVCGLLRHVSRQGASYIITFTDDFIRYGYGFEAPVKRDTPNKLQQRSIKCIFLGYPKETMGYYIYFPPENKIVVVMYAEFFEKNLISQEASGRVVEHEEIQYGDISPSKNTSEHHVMAESLEPQIDVAPMRRSERTHRAPDNLCLNVEVEEYSPGDLNEPTNYKAALSDPESGKWLDAMNAKMQSMKDNQVRRLVDLPPDAKTVGSK